ncbi:MAG: LysR family transcriptional regulator, partial [Xanthobacteraceae bacterium]|nr:LysR family transcriptional regulator [Xanthobacteraceae bacterium]
MNFDDVRVFARIAELKGISATARALGLPKSSVSRALARLEAAAGSALVERSTRHVRLTDAGVLFHAHAVRILGDIADAETALEGLAGAPRGLQPLPCGARCAWRALLPRPSRRTIS